MYQERSELYVDFDSGDYARSRDTNHQINIANACARSKSFQILGDQSSFFAPKTPEPEGRRETRSR